MGIVLENALLTDYWPPRVVHGALRIDGDRIAAVGDAVAVQPGDERIDCGGAVVLPGLVNGHTHLYSALAAGMPAPRQTPGNFHEILKFVWWRLDRALDAESVELSARIGAFDALHCGTTTLIDHHASPECIGGSLDMIEQGIARVGLRGVLCYETTDRNGAAGRDAGLAENRRYLTRCRDRADGRFAGLVGAHASFTCGDDTMAAMAAMAAEFAVGMHIHVAEDPVDERLCRADHGVALVDRLERFGMLDARNVFGHCTHLDASAVARVSAAQVAVGHNTRSNMNNAVGYAPVGALRACVQLGTDGIGADMFAEAQTAWFKSRDGGAGIGPDDVLRMLGNGARRASESLGVRLGVLEAGAAADVVVTDYVPATPLVSRSVGGHLLFAMGSRQVRDVLVGGEWALRDRRAVRCDEAASRHAARPAATALWDRMSRID
ncbi:MAG: amidohydrolase family protein [Candidatus Sumerlaeia bacterium]|nr:amidohydrolase family protein [Candidatus Sumerlaeia bacterium]